MIHKTGLLDYGFRRNNFADFKLDAIFECVQNNMIMWAKTVAILVVIFLKESNGEIASQCRFRCKY